MDNFGVGVVAYTFGIFLASGIHALRDIQLTVPEVVNIGGAPSLGCSWLLDVDETLYSVKWYWGPKEFYRYIPKELPHTRIFPVENINVDVSRSNARRVTLRDVQRALSGRFRCEVSADAPSFHTEFRSAFMHVLDLPESAPKILAGKTWYTVGDRLHAICTVPAADPPANITWLLNGHEVSGSSTSHLHTVPPSPDASIFDMWNDGDNGFMNKNVDLEPDRHFLVLRHEVTRDEDAGTTRKITHTGHLPAISHLAFVVRHEMYDRGTLRLTCIASIYSFYSARVELIFNHEKPQIASVLGVRNSASGSIFQTSILLAFIKIQIIYFAAR